MVRPDVGVSRIGTNYGTHGTHYGIFEEHAVETN
jgi:hypothetical protein